MPPKFDIDYLRNRHRFFSGYHVPDDEAIKIRQWLYSLAISSEMSHIWHMIHWKSETREVGDWSPLIDPAFQTEAGKRFLYYMWAIEETYLYHGVIPHSLAQLPPPSLNLPVSATDNSRNVVEVWARDIFLANVANSLVLEKNNLLPWSLVAYKESDLQSIFKSEFYYEYNSIRDQPGRIVVRYGSPGDPTEIFLWLYKMGFVSLNRTGKTIKLNNEERKKTRDLILNWCQDHFAHFSSAPIRNAPGFQKFKSSNVWMFNSPKEPLNTDDYRYTFLFGLTNEPPADKILSGYNTKVAEYEIQYPNGVWENTRKVSVPSYISAAPGGPPEQLYHYTSIGCWGASRFVSYVLRCANIPAYFVSGLFAEATRYAIGGHGSLIMPAEPNPANPKMWILYHADSLYQRGVRGLNPLVPSRGQLLENFMTTLFYTWDELFIALTKPQGRDAPFLPLPKSLVRKPITPGDQYSWKELNMKFWYDGRMKSVVDKKLPSLLSSYPSIPMIIAACMVYFESSKYSFLDRVKKTKNNLTYYVGPFSQFWYTREDLLDTINIQRKYTLELLKNKKLEQILSRAPLPLLSSVSDQAFYFFEIFDRYVLNRHLPALFVMPQKP